MAFGVSLLKKNIISNYVIAKTEWIKMFGGFVAIFCLDRVYKNIRAGRDDIENTNINK